jgi:DNA (cytosine-5)-methyltransferase 1
VGILAHGVAQRVEQLTALGNGQVPAVVRKAWRILTHNA